jgi:hypothetical protein
MSNVSRHFKLKGVMRPMILRDRSVAARVDSPPDASVGLNHFGKHLNQYLR